MKCETPIWIHKEGYLNKGINVPCGKCLNCLENKRAVWTFRIMNELDVAETARFVTLTYDEKWLPYINEFGEIYNLNDNVINGKTKELTQSLNLKDLQKFLKQLRNEIYKEYKTTFQGSKINDLKEAIRYVKKSKISGKWSPKVRYFACGEYGSKGDRPHYHIILFNIPKKWYIWDTIHREWYSPKLEEIWGKGIIDIGEVERASAHYVAKYTIKSLMDEWNENDIRVKPFAIMSKNPGIGANYINDENRDYFINTENNFTRLKGGYIQPIGRYYKDKIFKKEKIQWKFDYQITDEGYKKTTGTYKSSGIQLPNKSETKAKRKCTEHSKRKEEAEKNQILGENLGDIFGADTEIRRRRIEKNNTTRENTKHKLNKGNKL